MRYFQVEVVRAGETLRSGPDNEKRQPTPVPDSPVSHLRGVTWIPTNPIWVSDPMGEEEAHRLYTLSVVGPEHEIHLRYRGVLIRCRNDKEEFPVEQPLPDTQDSESYKELVKFKEMLQQYLDGQIRRWRYLKSIAMKKKNLSGTATTDHYITAFQRVRVYALGSALPQETATDRE